MENLKSDSTTLLDQKCEWRLAKSSKPRARRNWPRLRVVNGVFVVISSGSQIPAAT